MRTRIVILLVLIVVVGGFLLGRATAKTGGLPQQDEPGCTVPKAWGSCKGTTQAILFFEDSAGTIRGVPLTACRNGQSEVYLVIHRQ
jgi:hypothetical protein